MLNKILLGTSQSITAINETLKLPQEGHFTVLFAFILVEVCTQCFRVSFCEDLIFFFKDEKKINLGIGNCSD